MRTSIVGLLLLLVLVQCCFFRTGAETELSRQMRQYFMQQLTNLTKLNELFEENLRLFEFDTEKSESASISRHLTDWHDKIEIFLNNSVRALRKLVETAEDASTNFQYSSDYYFERDCNKSFYVNARDGNITTEFGDPNYPTIHIPIEVIDCETAVQRDARWLSNKSITDAFRINDDEGLPILRQYIASSETGITRIHPGQQWELDQPALTVVDLFDARSRQWYISSVNCPKDVMFLLDTSGSVMGQTKHLIKLTVMSILSTLNANDYINAAWFNKETELLIGKCFDGFMAATTRNKLLLERALESLSEANETHFGRALNFSYEAFGKLSNLSKIYETLQYGSGCHKVLFVMTDSVEESGYHLLEKIESFNEAPNVRFFGFAMGFGITDIEALRFLSCHTNGGYSVVDSLEDIKKESLRYIPVLSRPLAMFTREKPVSERQVSWTGPYMDAQGKGPVVTLSMPILNNMEFAGSDKFLGVAGIDIQLSQLQNMADESLNNWDNYVFALDNNGHALFHPQLRTQEPALQMKRRTACFDAMPDRKKESDKVIFWSPTEETMIEMGFVDSIATVDFIELEIPSEQLFELREIMVTDQCTSSTRIVSNNTMFFTENYAFPAEFSYRCRKLSGTPYSIAVASKRNKRWPVARLTEPDSRPDTTDFIVPEDDFVTFLFPPSVLCGIDLSTIESPLRYMKFNESLYGNSEMCKESRSYRLLLDYSTVQRWLSSWDYVRNENMTCLDFAAKVNGTLVFIQTDAGLTSFFPKCAYNVPTMLYKQVRQSHYYRYVRQYPQDLNFLWTSDTGNRLAIVTGIYLRDSVWAVVGALVPSSFINHLWFAAENNSVTNSRCWKDSDGSVCYLVNRHFMVIASSSVHVVPTAKLHFAAVEPSLFDHLVNHSDDFVISHEFIDYQWTCSPDDRRPNRAGRWMMISVYDLFFHLLNGFVNMLNASFWVNVWAMWMNFLTVSDGGRVPMCDNRRPTAGEQCIMRHYLYLFNHSGSQHLEQFNDRNCDANFTYEWTKINNTNLYLFQVFRPMKCPMHYHSVYSFQPQRVPECEEIRNYKRHRFRKDCQPYHPREMNLTEACGCGMIRPYNAFIFLCFIISVILRFHVFK